MFVCELVRNAVQPLSLRHQAWQWERAREQKPICSWSKAWWKPASLDRGKYIASASSVLLFLDEKLPGLALAIIQIWKKLAYANSVSVEGVNNAGASYIFSPFSPRLSQSVAVLEFAELAVNSWSYFYLFACAAYICREPLFQESPLYLYRDGLYDVRFKLREHPMLPCISQRFSNWL